MTGGSVGRPRKPPTVGRYQVDITSFESIALPILEHISTKHPAESSRDTGTPCGPKNLGNRAKDSEEPKMTSANSSMSGNDGKSAVSSEEMLPVQQPLSMKKQLVVIDEIGKMELFSRSFIDSIKTLFDDSVTEGKVVLATVPVAGRGKPHWLLEQLRQRKDCKLFQVLHNH